MNFHFTLTLAEHTFVIAEMLEGERDIEDTISRTKRPDIIEILQRRLDTYRSIIELMQKAEMTSAEVRR